MTNDEKINISFKGEFGYEVILAFPYAYWLYKNNLLGSTISSKDTKCFYYFSKLHEEKFDCRRGYLYNSDYGGNDLQGNPNKTIHKSNLDTTKFIMPPYKEIYKNNLFIFDKPLIMISNKYYSTGRNENRYLNIEILKEIFDILSSKFTIIYNRALKNNIVEDQNLIDEKFEDHNLIKQLNNPNIIDINELYLGYKNMLSFNTFQCMLKANCEKYISVQGGTSIFSSLFGGTNIIYADNCMETKFNSFNWYTKLSNADILHVNNYTKLVDYVKYINEI